MKTAKRVGLLLTTLGVLYVAEPASAYYDPGVQRWINRDPIGQDAWTISELREDNLYRFVSNCAFSFLDPDGRQTTSAAGEFVPPPGGTELGSTDCSTKPPTSKLTAAGKALPKVVQNCVLKHESVHAGSNCGKNYNPVPCSHRFPPGIRGACAKLWDEVKASQTSEKCATEALKDPNLSAYDRAALKWYFDNAKKNYNQAMNAWAKRCK